MFGLGTREQPTRVSSAALVAVAIVLALVAPSHARGRGHPGGHHSHHHHGGPRHHGHGLHGPRFGGPAYPSWSAYSYADRPLVYWYCSSAGAYYPDLQSCPEPWVPLPTE